MRGCHSVAPGLFAKKRLDSQAAPSQHMDWRTDEQGELVDDIAQRTNLSKADASEILATVLDAIRDGLQRGQEVSITGFANSTLLNGQRTLGAILEPASRSR